MSVTSGYPETVMLAKLQENMYIIWSSFCVCGQIAAISQNIRKKMWF